MSLQNRKVGYLTLVPQSVTNSELGMLAVQNANIANATINFLKSDVNFASNLLDTTKRALYPLIGVGALALATAATMDVSASFGAATASTAVPTYSAVTRAWSNLGPVTYAAENKVSFHAPGPAGQPDQTNPLIDAATGNEVYGRLTFAAAVWTLSFFTAPAGVETAYSMPAGKTAFAYFKQWVPGSSTLLEDPTKLLVQATSAVDITETDNIVQLAKDLGVTLGNSGQMSLAKSVVQRISDHVAGTFERHTSVMTDTDASVVIPGFTVGTGAGHTVSDALNQLQANVTSAASAGTAALQLYFSERTSNGVIGTAAPLSAGAGLIVNVAAFTTYVSGVRYTKGATTFSATASATTVAWVDNTGTIVTGASYPVGSNFAKLGTVVAGAGAITSITDDHLALVPIDQKIVDVQTLLNAHIASTTAHAASAITWNNAASAIAGNPTNVQSAVDGVVTRINAVSFGAYQYTLQAADISGATVDASRNNYVYTTLTLPSAYKLGINTLVVYVDGDFEDPITNNAGVWTGTFLEQDATHVRVYWDPAAPFIAGQRIKVRWLVV